MIIVIIIPVYICHFKSEKVGDERAELRKFEYPENEKSFLHEIKNILHNF